MFIGIHFASKIMHHLSSNSEKLEKKEIFAFTECLGELLWGFIDHKALDINKWNMPHGVQ